MVAHDVDEAILLADKIEMIGLPPEKWSSLK
jgi:ABC-type nitrate/sulfonate/bicarbonate transport system ATPase subunit